MSMDASVIILAAGKGTRMKSETVKVLQIMKDDRALRREMVHYLLAFEYLNISSFAQSALFVFSVLVTLHFGCQIQPRALDKPLFILA